MEPAELRLMYGAKCRDGHACRTNKVMRNGCYRRERAIGNQILEQMTSHRCMVVASKGKKVIKMDWATLYTLSLPYLVPAINAAGACVRGELSWLCLLWRGLRTNDLPAKDCIKFLWVSFATITTASACFLLAFSHSHLNFNWVMFGLIFAYGLSGTQRTVGYIEGKSEHITQFRLNDDDDHRN